MRTVGGAEVRRLVQADADAIAQLRTDMEALRRGWDEVDARLRVLEDERAVALARDASSEGEKGRERQTTFLPGA